MHKEFRRAEWIRLSQGVNEPSPERHRARIALRALQQGKKPEDILKLLEFDNSFQHILSQQGNEPAQKYTQNALQFAMQVYQQAQQTASQLSYQTSWSSGLSR